jgi:hypothetical protein
VFVDGVAMGLPCQFFKLGVQLMSQTSKTFIPTQLGITAFMKSTGVDFVLEGPSKAATRPVRINGKLKLDGKALSVVEAKLSDDGEVTGLLVKWGKEQILLGRRKNASGPVSFYRNLENEGGSFGAPKTAAEILAVLAAFK